ncbi:MAG: RNA polymerase sigma factor [Planctomycetes bacterium]|jgi:RNA polymerase sigma-70 factor (ECF subfamily)|nr:RNA polymerase sigma factor [Planctomycetota bacterium]
MDSRTKSLCRRARSGDKNAACELLEIHHADIFAYLRRLCGNRQDAEDLTQQTFLNAWSSLHKFAGRSEFSTWLHRIAHNAYIDWRRKGPGATRNYPDRWWDECIDKGPDSFATVVERQMAQRLYEAVDQLDDDTKHVVHLHYYEHLSLRQTAKVLDVATSTVKYRLREVLRVLRARLGVEENEPNGTRTIPIPNGEMT